MISIFTTLIACFSIFSLNYFSILRLGILQLFGDLFTLAR